MDALDDDGLVAALVVINDLLKLCLDLVALILVTHQGPFLLGLNILRDLNNIRY